MRGRSLHWDVVLPVPLKVAVGRRRSIAQVCPAPPSTSVRGVMQTRPYWYTGTPLVGLSVPAQSSVMAAKPHICTHLQAGQEDPSGCVHARAHTHTHTCACMHAPMHVLSVDTYLDRCTYLCTLTALGTSPCPCPFLGPVLHFAPTLVSPGHQLPRAPLQQAAIDRAQPVALAAGARRAVRERCLLNVGVMA